MTFSSDYQQNKKDLKQALRIEESFDLICKDTTVGSRSACFFFVDGLTKDETMQKLLSGFYTIKPEDMPENASDFSTEQLPYIEVDLSIHLEQTITSILSGMTALLIDGYDAAICMDVRTYPARSVDQPEKEKVLRGSKDGFVETIVFNTALIRRRIRDPKLTMEMISVGSISHTDVVLCYMNDIVDKNLLTYVRTRLQNMEAKSLNMNQTSLAECLYERKWYNPFPKYKYTERPDTSAASIMEGNLVILVDNSPSAIILPTSLFGIMEEADDYYLPPITGTYLRLTRFLISTITFFITPVFLLLTMYPEWIPKWLSFIELQEYTNVPLMFQFLILEIAIDGLRLAAVNTPSMLSTPLSIIAGLALGEYAVSSGWFNAESMLYMAFVALANYTQPSYELGYALKFFRIITLILTGFWGIWGLIAGTFCLIIALLTNHTIDGRRRYLYPLIPFDWKVLKRQLLRLRRDENS
ncbi:MAG: spore germination protein [Lachnospiraceae bacterium]|nr:spore germination protein [Lachnospiraceae bacterium]MEE1015643.1 spore germination protein [Lachnospiraceae bacterium]